MEVMGNRKMISTMYREFEKRYTPNQIADSLTLMALYGYLSSMMKRINGDYYHEPSLEVASLISIHLSENRFKSITEPLPEPTITYKKCMDCFYLETCEYIEKGLTEYIEKCSIVKKK